MWSLACWTWVVCVCGAKSMIYMFCIVCLSDSQSGFSAKIWDSLECNRAASRMSCCRDMISLHLSRSRRLASPPHSRSV
jgi:hypothetical protein